MMVSLYPQTHCEPSTTLFYTPSSPQKGEVLEVPFGGLSRRPLDTRKMQYLGQCTICPHVSYTIDIHMHR